MFTVSFLSWDRVFGSVGVVVRAIQNENLFDQLDYNKYTLECSLYPKYSGSDRMPRRDRLEAPGRSPLAWTGIKTSVVVPIHAKDFASQPQPHSRTQVNRC
jgi:hypothetical protein